MPDTPWLERVSLVGPWNICHLCQKLVGRETPKKRPFWERSGPISNRTDTTGQPDLGSVLLGVKNELDGLDLACLEDGLQAFLQDAMVTGRQVVKGTRAYDLFRRLGRRTAVDEENCALAIHAQDEVWDSLEHGA